MGRKATGQWAFEDGQWTVRFWTLIDGEKVRVKRALGTANRQAAQIKYERMQREGCTAEPEVKRAETLQEAATRVYEARALQYYKDRPGTRANKGPREELRSLVRWVFPLIGMMPIDAVEGTDINGVLDSVRAAGKSRATVGHVRERLSSLFIELKRSKAVKQNPVIDSTMPRFAKVAKRARAVLTDHELAIYLAWEHPCEGYRSTVRERQTMACVSRMFGGVRTGDMHALRWTDFDCEHGAFAWGFAPRQKTAQPQMLEVPEMLRPMLHDYWQRAGRPQDGLLFPIRRGGRAGTQRQSHSHAAAFRKDLQMAFRAAPASTDAPREGSHRWLTLFDKHQTRTLPVDFHSWRRAFVQALKRANVNAQNSAELAGHADLAAHFVYCADPDSAAKLPASALPAITIGKGHRERALLTYREVSTDSAAYSLRSDSACLATTAQQEGAKGISPLTPPSAVFSLRKPRLMGWIKAPSLPIARALTASGPGYHVVVYLTDPALQPDAVRSAITSAMEASQ